MCLSWLRELWRRMTSKTLVMSRGMRVVVGSQLAEGGFSFVFNATSGKHKFALKKMLCQNPEQLNEAKWEIAVHKAMRTHKSLLRLIDHASVKTAIGTEMYLLYILYENGTVRDLINRHIKKRSCIPEGEILEIFAVICSAVSHLHNHKPAWAHRDIKPENVLLDDHNSPVLMDFGSVAPAEVTITTRSEALLLQEDAAEHCSMAYRAPELFDVSSDAKIDARSDVWSLGCVLFAMAFGYSPFECTFTSQGTVAAECSYLRVIGKIPFPDSCSYSQEFCDTILWLLQQDPAKRPNIHDTIERIKQLQEGRFVSVPSRAAPGAGPPQSPDQGGWATF